MECPRHGRPRLDADSWNVDLVGIVDVEDRPGRIRKSPGGCCTSFGRHQELRPALTDAARKE